MTYPCTEIWLSIGCTERPLPGHGYIVMYVRCHVIVYAGIEAVAGPRTYCDVIRVRRYDCLLGVQRDRCDVCKVSCHCLCGHRGRCRATDRSLCNVRCPCPHRQWHLHWCIASTMTYPQWHLIDNDSSVCVRTYDCLCGHRGCCWATHMCVRFSWLHRQ